MEFIILTVLYFLHGSAADSDKCSIMDVFRTCDIGTSHRNILGALDFEKHQFVLEKMCTTRFYLSHKHVQLSEPDASTLLAITKGSEKILQIQSRAINETYMIDINFPFVNKKWNLVHHADLSENNGSFGAVFSQNKQDSPDLYFKANWSTSHNITELKAHMMSEDRPIAIISASRIIEGNDWDATLKLESQYFDWKVEGKAKGSRQDGSYVRAHFDANRWARGKKPIKYDFELREATSSPYFILKHNIFSEYYTFEGNMVVFRDSKTNSTVTEIVQKTSSSVWPTLNSDLKQIFHQTWESFWETVVLKSGLVDMHVSGQWETSVWNFYRKKFRFQSHFEDLLPSVDITLAYTSHRHFFHEFHFPFLAKKCHLIIDLAEEILPAMITVGFQDEFVTNKTQNILQIVISGTLDSMQIDVTAGKSFWTLTDLLSQHLMKIWTHWKNISSDKAHPVNVLLSPLLNLEDTDLASWLGKIPSWVKLNLKETL